MSDNNKKQLTDDERIKIGQTRLTAFRSAKAAINAQIKDNETWFRSRHCTTMYEAVPKAPGDPQKGGRRGDQARVTVASECHQEQARRRHG